MADRRDGLTGAEPLNYRSGWETSKDPTTLDRFVIPPVSSGQAMAHPLPPTVKRGDRVLNDIDNAADYYGPETYRSLLTFYSSSEFDLDFNTDFIPICQTKANPKLFVIGLIPPSANITKRVLDRSASVSVVNGYPDQQLDFSGAGANGAGGTPGASASSGSSGIVTAPGYTLRPASGTSKGVQAPEGGKGPSGGNPVETKLSIPQIWNLMATCYRKAHNSEPTSQELQFYVAQVLRETSGNIPNNNFGFVGNFGKTAPSGKESFYSKNDGNYYQTYDSLESGATHFLRTCTQGNARAAAKSGDALGYLTSLAQNGYYTASVEAYYHGPKPKIKNGLFPDLLGDVAREMAKHGVNLDDGSRLPENAPRCGAYTERMEDYIKRRQKGDSTFRFMENTPYDSKCSLIAPTAEGSPGTNEGWVDKGSKSAANAKDAASKVVDTDLNASSVGKRFQQAQYLEGVLTEMLQDQMARTPPLRLLVNPTSFKISSEKLVSDGNWTRNGPIIEHWGDQQDKLEATGSLAAFFAIDANNPNLTADGSSPGLTRVARNYSESFRNFLSLYLLYKNNGYLFTAVAEQASQSGGFFNRLSLVGSIYIYYDSALYIGSFDNFNITETDDKPYTIEYNFQFTVRATFLLDRPDEFTYGRDMFSDHILPAQKVDTLDPNLLRNQGGGPVSLPPLVPGNEGTRVA